MRTISLLNFHGAKGIIDGFLLHLERELLINVVGLRVMDPFLPRLFVAFNTYLGSQSEFQCSFLRWVITHEVKHCHWVVLRWNQVHSIPACLLGWWAPSPLFRCCILHHLERVLEVLRCVLQEMKTWLTRTVFLLLFPAAIDVALATFISNGVVIPAVMQGNHHVSVHQACHLCQFLIEIFIITCLVLSLDLSLALIEWKLLVIKRILLLVVTLDRLG